MGSSILLLINIQIVLTSMYVTVPILSSPILSFIVRSSLYLMLAWYNGFLLGLLLYFLVDFVIIDCLIMKILFGYTLMLHGFDVVNVKLVTSVGYCVTLDRRIENLDAFKKLLIANKEGLRHFTAYPASFFGKFYWKQIEEGELKKQF